MAYFEKTKLSDKDGNLINPSEEDTAQYSNNILIRILSMLISPVGFDRSLNRQRSTAVIESGTVTGVTAVTAVTTVTTVTGLTNIDSRNGSMLINATNYTAWASANRNLIS